MDNQIFDHKKIVLAVTGSIAVYKAVDLASKLTQAGALVDVVMSESAQRFVTPLTFQSVTGRPVHTDMWQEQTHVQHVRLGEQADLMVVAPATAHTISRLAQGAADNMVTLTALTARCPLVVAPAMDGGMFSNKAVQTNLQILIHRGATILGPAEGRMASGLFGKGRLLEPAQLFQHLRHLLARNGRLEGRHVVVTAGPTQEPLDPVRFLSNRSTGKQGLALAQAALDLGATVSLITGPISEPIPAGANQIKVRTAVEMAEVVKAATRSADILLMAAAVADFRPATVADQKIKKTAMKTDEPSVVLARNPDILEAVKEQREQDGFPRVVVGFAAETKDVIKSGKDKLARKGMDLIAINDVSADDAGFAVDDNRVILLGKDGFEAQLPLQSKYEVAMRILEQATDYLLNR
ncbi:MAG: bifunctional phosphopantothenoylcysteine decarboxylase/phosphopantothenate--cysteine ligase CoaBC [Anaerolineales bacterium]|nr:bifunctional phosphopantothenoylcysteine decarboxylase/phosphopantothenate--cysteine ligase CoaBC [Anaerolineales bacterium]MCB0006846.1 bifunctional phosphopantothenoylcysteine decarboxylase/phosphopantothenate--cysteine ligase CoaBC [Anaerolineales bacterium]MCB0012419.1 bifunctional phosphopantothenoylcysteine decarboxylase/phosphopantothenate--cysteine ligase CoaBC [Anaerolineales bacterium]MCB0031314.1 bifunctional phosphopantothenoylcysteine decarboxylase/phosphopantothenate--cysteine l